MSAIGYYHDWRYYLVKVGSWKKRPEGSRPTGARLSGASSHRVMSNTNSHDKESGNIHNSFFLLLLNTSL
jgi:hypothetical protein